MIKEFHYSFHELNVVPSDLEELLGFEKGEVPEPFPGLIESGLSEAARYCDIRGGMRIFKSIFFDVAGRTLSMDNQVFVPDEIVMARLKNATRAALFVCTAGSEITAHSKQITENGDPMLGYVFDVVGSVVVDKAMDKMQEELKAEMSVEGLGISDRFSPGYCKWDVAEQQKLFSLLPVEFCGIKLSSSSLMDPIKSVSGIIGIGHGLEQTGYQCHWCNDAHCIIGKAKRKKTIKKNG